MIKRENVVEQEWSDLRVEQYANHLALLQCMGLGNSVNIKEWEKLSKADFRPSWNLFLMLLLNRWSDNSQLQNCEPFSFHKKVRRLSSNSNDSARANAICETRLCERNTRVKKQAAVG